MDFILVILKRMQQVNLEANVFFILSTLQDTEKSCVQKIIMDQNVIQAVKLHYRNGILKQIVVSEVAVI